MNSDAYIVLAILTFLIASMVFYLIFTVVNGEDVCDRVERQGGSALLSKRWMNYGVWILSPIVKLLYRFSVAPNTVTSSSIVFGMLAGFFISIGLFGLASIAAIISGMADVLDGMLARKINKIDGSGVVYDSLVDRYVDFFLLAGCAIYFRGEIWSLLFCLLALHGSFMISYTSAKAESMQLNISRGMMKRTERYVYLLIGIVLTAFSVDWGKLFGIPINPLIISVALIALLTNYFAILRFRELFLNARLSK